jgi:hypothetical protein
VFRQLKTRRYAFLYLLVAVAAMAGVIAFQGLLTFLLLLIVGLPSIWLFVESSVFGSQQ